MKRFFLWLGIGILALILMVVASGALFIGWMKWAGDRDWERAQQELRAKGEKLTFAELVPPSPPDSENFFADPIWQQLADMVPVKGEYEGHEYDTWAPRVPKDQLLINQWKTPLSASEQELLTKLTHKEGNFSDHRQAISFLNQELSKSTDPEKSKALGQAVLDLMQPAVPLIAKITELAKRPGASFPLRYQDGARMALPPLSELLIISQLLGCRTAAELTLGNTDAAFSDTQTLLRLANVQRNEPLLISFLVRMVILKMGLTSLDKGISLHQWNDPQLEGFQQTLQSFHLIQDLPFVLRGERAFFNSVSQSQLELLILNKPVAVTAYKALFIYDKAHWDILVQHSVETLEHASAINITTPLFNQEMKRLKANPIQKWLHFIEYIGSPIDLSIQKAVETQTQISQSLIVCALERYRIAHAAYPASLNTLVPEYLSAIPKEPTTGDPMHYRLVDNDHFVLWAPGWKLQTLNGKPGEYTGEGDIVWGQPLPRRELESHSSEQN